MPEPGNPQSLNRYSYVLNNPLRYTDPTGMFSEDEIMQYLGVSAWDDVLAMFGEGGAMAGAWGFLEVLRQAELGTPISMWFDAGSGFNASQPNMMGMFSEQDGALVFSGAFLDWSGAGGSWAVGGLSAVTASTLLPSTGQYQVGSRIIGAQSQFSHLVFRPDQVDWTAVGLDAMGLAGDAGYAMIGARVLAVGVGTGGVGLLLGGVVISGLATAANMTSAGKAIADYQRGNSTEVGLVVDLSLGAGGALPVVGTYTNIISLGKDLRPGAYFGP